MYICDVYCFNVVYITDLALHKLYQTVKKPDVADETKDILRDHLSLEYDFYHFVKQRFYTILTKIRFMKRNVELEDKRMKRREHKFNKLWENMNE